MDEATAAVLDGASLCATRCWFILGFLGRNVNEDEIGKGARREAHESVVEN